MKIQQTSFKENRGEKTKDDLAIFHNVLNDEWKTFKIYLCQKHDDIFFRHEGLGYGMCWKCRNQLKPNEKIMIEDITGKRLINVYPLQEYHASDINLISEYMDRRNNMKVEESVPIEDGKYTGVINDVVEVTEPYEYTEFVIGFEINDRKIDLQFGCPSKILLDKKTKKPTSKLAQTLEEFGFKMPMGKEITIPDLKKHFVGLKVSSLITNKKTNRGTFAQVMTMIPRL